MPADVISKGLLSDLQLEAIVYGCQRHEKHLPYDDGSHSFANNDSSDHGKKNEKGTKSSSPSSNKEKKVSTTTMVRADNVVEDSSNKNSKKEEKKGPRQGFLVGDGAGMGKGQ